MRIKWYIYSFVLSLTLLGIIQQYKEPKANQEILIQFLGTEFTARQTQESIELIEVSLKEIGAKSISIVSDKEGNYKIAYHSDTSVYKIEKLITDKAEISIDKDSGEGSSGNKTYNIDVFKIDKGQTSSWDFEGQEVVIFNLKSDRSYKLKLFKHSFIAEEDKLERLYKYTNNTGKLSQFTSDRTAYNIPETRAGPTI